jgi:hypothetical protein
MLGGKGKGGRVGQLESPSGTELSPCLRVANLQKIFFMYARIGEQRSSVYSAKFIRFLGSTRDPRHSARTASLRLCCLLFAVCCSLPPAVCVRLCAARARSPCCVLLSCGGLACSWCFCSRGGSRKQVARSPPGPWHRSNTTPSTCRLLCRGQHASRVGHHQGFAEEGKEKVREQVAFAREESSM